MSEMDRVMGSYVKYTEIVDNIKQKIQNNIFKSDELLPSEKELCLEYNVSRRTVRRAIDELVEAGFLYTVPGKGTFVRVLNRDSYEMNMKFESMIYKGFDKTILYDATILSPDVYQVYNLQVSPEDKVLRIRSVLKRGDTSIAFDEKHIPYFLGIPLKEENINYNNLRDILKTKISLYEMKEEVYVSSAIANAFIKDVMHLEKDEPMMIVDTIIRDRDDMPLGWNKVYILWNECVLRGISV